MVKHYQNINPFKLHEELIKNGIEPIFLENDCPEYEHNAENVWITFKENVNIDLVNQIIDSVKK